MLYHSNAVERVAEILLLRQESNVVQEKVITILNNYCTRPFLFDKEIIHLIRGDEGFPDPILIQHGSYSFNLYAAIDCIFREPDGTIHILDFKTGKTEFDRRQGFVYLLAASYLYPQQPTVASFYNLETRKWSNPIRATPLQIKAIQVEMMRIAQRHQRDLYQYRQKQSNFNQIYPPNPGSSCRYCQFNSVCEFSTSEISA